jgi:hypothetical protein
MSAGLARLGVLPCVADAGGDDHAVAPIGESATEYLLHPAVPVAVGRIEQRDPPVDRGMQQAHGLIIAVITPPPGGARLATECQFGHADTRARNLPVSHGR